MSDKKEKFGMFKNVWRTDIAILFSMLMLSFTMSAPILAVDIDTEQIEKNHTLQNIRTKIKDVESSIKTARQTVDQLFNELQENEVAAVEASSRIQDLQEQSSEKNRQLEQLNKSKAQREVLLKTQRQHLAQQIRAAYKTGRNNYLQLLLNQQEPERVGRILAYYNYDAEARSKRIAGINLALTEISSLQERIQSETQALTQLQREQELKLGEYQLYRASREKTIIDMQVYIEDQGGQLQILQDNEQQLTKLVSELKHQELAIQIFEDMPPFSTLQGKLEWPVRGRISSRYGSLRKGGKLKWQGVTIAASNGVEVRAITTGKVVFADWFRNMGLLMILDHGDGFMSLYGHNERLLKKPGDWVLTGDSIARVGDTGGQNRPGLYFEIRQSGNPINPNLWCKN